MAVPSWALPAGLAAAVVGGLAFLGMQNKKTRLGDLLAVSPPAAIPGVPANAYAAVQVGLDKPLAQGPDIGKWQGLIVGTIDGSTGQVALFPAALPGSVNVAPADVRGVWRRRGDGTFAKIA